MGVTVKQLADLVRGTVFGRDDLPIQGAGPLQEAQPGDISFLENKKYLPQLEQSKASAIVVAPDFPVNGKTLIQVADPLNAFITIVKYLRGIEDPKPTGIDQRAIVAPTAKIGQDPSIGPNACIGEGTIIGDRCRISPGAVVGRNCRLGNDVILHPNVVLYDDTILGDRVIIHANAVIGSDGFGYRFQNGKHVKVPQLGWVEIANDVEIGACTTIDRGTFQPTRISLGTKIDNLVQIAHNVTVGPHNLLVSQVGIAGSSITGSYVVMTGQVGIPDHVHIGDGAMIGAKSGIIRDVPAGQRVLGYPAEPDAVQKRIWLTLPKIPEMARDIRKIKKQLGIAEEQP